MPKNKMQAANAPVAAGAVPRDGGNSLASCAAAPPSLGVGEGPAYGRAYMDLTSRFLFPNNTQLVSPMRSRQQKNPTGFAHAQQTEDGIMQKRVCM